jgi:hypothetical protein
LSHVWPLIFEKLREEGTQRRDVAELLGWPLDELKSLMFQLILSDTNGGNSSGQAGPPTDLRKAMRLVE